MKVLSIAIVVVALLPRPAHSDRLEKCFEAAFRAETCIAVVERKCRAENGQAGAECLRQEADAWDALLNRYWKSLKDQTEERSKDSAMNLLSAQRAWIHFRDAECSYLAAEAANNEASTRQREACRLSVTARRVLDFSAWLHRSTVPLDDVGSTATETLLHCLRYAYNPADCNEDIFPEPNYLGGWAARVRLAEGKRATWDAVLETVMARLLHNAEMLDERYPMMSLVVSARQAYPDPITGLYSMTLRDALKVEHVQWLAAREARCTAWWSQTWSGKELMGATSEEMQPQCLAEMTAVHVLAMIQLSDFTSRFLAIYDNPFPRK